MNHSLRARKHWFRAALLGCLALSPLHAQDAPLKLARTIPLPGVEGRIDHFGFDSVSQRLFVCALGNNSVEVIDVRKSQRIHSITGLGAPQGVVYVPEVDRLFVANDQSGICKIYSGKSYQELAVINLGNDADNVRYDTTAKRVYIGFGGGGLAIINPADGKQVGSINLSAHPEAFQMEANGKRIFINIPNARHIAVVDRDQGRVIATWKTDLAFANFPMAFDETNHRLFVGCRLPSKLLVLNTGSGDVVAKIDIASDPDDIFYDTRRRRVYVTCGAGEIDIIDQVDPNNYKIEARIDTAPGARTGLFVPELGELFVAVPHRGSQNAEIRAYQVE